MFLTFWKIDPEFQEISREEKPFHACRSTSLQEGLVLYLQAPKFPSFLCKSNDILHVKRFSSVQSLSRVRLIVVKTCRGFFGRANTLFFFFFNVDLMLLLLLFSRSVVSSSLWPLGLQHARLPCPSLSPRVCSNSCPLSQWCHPTISSSVIPFSSCPQSFPASGSFQMSQVFASGGQSIGASA